MFKEWSSEWTDCVDGYAAREQRIDQTQRAMAAAAIMAATPRPQPVQVQPVTIYPSVNCTSNRVGTYTYTNCN
jgi:hypothetical protein